MTRGDSHRLPASGVNQQRGRPPPPRTPRVGKEAGGRRAGPRIKGAGRGRGCQTPLESTRQRPPEPSSLAPMLPFRTPRATLLAGWLLLLLGHACPQAVGKDNREICLQPPDKGSCRALHERWFYDRYTQTCKTFTYGGCEGNTNNFLSEEDCEKTCWMIRRVPKICRLESDEGHCRALIPKYFFNLTSMACEKFYYGGCSGNDNQFDSKDSCMDYCLPQKDGPSFCYSPKDEGTCSASVTRFYYNRKTKTCEKFIYTGCGGNENNFARMKDCIKVCKKAQRKPKPRI